MGKILLIGLCSRLIVFSSAIVSSYFLGTPNNELGNMGIPVINLFSQWDSGWYAKIALAGYPPGINPVSMNWAFFPLYPFFMRAFGTLTFSFLTPFQSVLVSGFFISNVLFFACLMLFYKVTKVVLGNTKVALISTAFFAFWPGALFFSTVYSESLFMALLLGAFYYLEKKQTVKSTALGFLAGLARSNGFMIFIPFLYSGVQTRKYRTAIIQSIVLILPYFLFNVYGYFQTGLFPIREIIYGYVWGNSRVSLTGIFDYWMGFMVLYAVEALLIALPFFWFLYTEKIPIKDFVSGSSDRKDLKYWVFSIYIVLTLLFYSDPKNLHRYAIPIMPLYWVNAYVWTKNEKAGKLMLITLTTILVIGTILFTSANWYL